MLLLEIHHDIVSVLDENYVVVEYEPVLALSSGLILRIFMTNETRTGFVTGFRQLKTFQHIADLSDDLWNKFTNLRLRKIKLNTFFKIRFFNLLRHLHASISGLFMAFMRNFQTFTFISPITGLFIAFMINFQTLSCIFPISGLFMVFMIFRTWSVHSYTPSKLDITFSTN